MIGQWTYQWTQSMNLVSHYSPAAGSTNDLAKNFNYPNKDSVVFLTDHQTSGRGRHENVWIDSGSGQNLLSSWVFAMDQAPQPIASPLIGLAVVRALSTVFPTLAFSLKAPNDVLLNGFKCAGILLELISQGEDHRLIVGLGLNVKASPASGFSATHLEAILGRPIPKDEWEAFLNHLLVQLTDALSECTERELSIRAVNDLLHWLNQNPHLTEPITDVMPDGTLISAGQVIAWSQL
jgi:BirA family biotin operon repressor/biotin-[acetyl-CoA-carboxylase] ligase